MCISGRSLPSVIGIKVWPLLPLAVVAVNACSTIKTEKRAAIYRELTKKDDCSYEQRAAVASTDPQRLLTRRCCT